MSDKTTNKINEDNLLNFYLSSITAKDFSYKPTKSTKEEIWKYLNASNLIRLDDFSDKIRLKELEQAANTGQVDSETIFNIYSQIPFSLNELVNAKNNYRKLDFNEARPLIYQKYLLSEDNDTKLEYLLLLEELLKR